MKIEISIYVGSILSDIIYINFPNNCGMLKNNIVYNSTKVRKELDRLFLGQDIVPYFFNENGQKHLEQADMFFKNDIDFESWNRKYKIDYLNRVL